MNAERFFKEMFSSIWQGEHLEKLDAYYAKDFEESVSISDKDQIPLELKLDYHGIVKQALWYKENYKDVTLEIKKIVSGAENTLSVYFYSSSIVRRSGEMHHRWVCGIWRLNSQNQIDRVWAVVTPYYA